jgi:hypothetical protein
VPLSLHYEIFVCFVIQKASNTEACRAPCGAFQWLGWGWFTNAAVVGATTSPNQGAA